MRGYASWKMRGYASRLKPAASVEAFLLRHRVRAGNLRGSRALLALAGDGRALLADARDVDLASVSEDAHGNEGHAGKRANDDAHDGAGSETRRATAGGAGAVGAAAAAAGCLRSGVHVAVVVRVDGLDRGV